MKSILFPLFFAAGSLVAQTPPPYKKIKVILLGTFHFNQSLDSSSKLHSNLFSEKRQQEVAALVSRLAKQKPDKIFLEFTPANQPFYDSIYNDYLKGPLPSSQRTKGNEIFQLGMQTAKQLGHSKVYGINYQPEELATGVLQPRNRIDSIMKDLFISFKVFEDTTRTNSAFYDLPFPRRFPKADSLLQVSTLTQYLLYLNEPEKLKRDEYTNWNYLYSMGTGKDMSSTDYPGTFWYGTNLRNFNNVLRETDYEQDRCYLIIYGSSHIPILSYFFSMHPYFEVMNLNKVLN